MNRKPTIVHSVRRFIKLSENWIYHQIAAARRFRPIVLTRRRLNQNTFPLENVYVVRPSPRWRAFAARLRLSAARIDSPNRETVCRKFRARLLHSHFGPQGWQDMELAKKLALPHVVSFYGFDMSQLPNVSPRWYERYQQLFETVKAVIVEGPYAADTVHRLGCPLEKIVINRIGVDLGRIRFQPRSIGPDEAIRLLVAGRFTEKKGIPYAVAAFAAALKCFPNMRMTIVGDASGASAHQQEKRKSMTLIRKNRLRKKIRWIPFLPYAAFLEEAYGHHIFLSPSITSQKKNTEGGSPVVLTEMVASGMPVVASLHADIPEIVFSGENGFLVEEKDVTGLANAIIQLAADPGKWPQMGKAGRRIVAERFDLKTQVPRLEAIYQQSLT